SELAGNQDEPSGNETSGNSNSLLSATTSNSRLRKASAVADNGALRRVITPIVRGTLGAIIGQWRTRWAALEWARTRAGMAETTSASSTMLSTVGTRETS